MSPLSLTEIVSVVSDAFVALSAFVVAVLGVVGVWQWRKELTGKARFETARKLALLSLQFRDKFRRARSPFTFPGESTDRLRNDSKSEEENRLLDEFFARRERIEFLGETLVKLQVAGWEAEIILGEDIGELLQPFERGFADLWTTTEAYFRTQLERARSGQKNPETDDWLKSQHAMIYGVNDEPSRTIDAAVDALLSKLKTYVK